MKPSSPHSLVAAATVALASTAVPLAAAAHRDIVWQFHRAGDFGFACLQPGHFEAGIGGRVTVK